jgi:N-acetylmuramoyl-L-alanine amidase
MGPRMARYASSFFLVAGMLFIAAGCQEQPVVDQLPAANFNGPLVQPPPPVIQTPKPVAVKPIAPPKKATPHLAGIPREWIPNTTKPDGWKWIVIHHSATPSGGAKAFDKMHKAKGWDELGYHFVVGNGTDTADGQIEVGPRWPKQKWGAHAKTPDNRFNNFGIGICLVGNFDVERPTKAQIQNLSRLVAYLMKTYHIPADHVIGHGETKATDCPGRNVHIADIRKLAVQYAAGDVPPDTYAQSPNTELLVATHHKK